MACELESVHEMKRRDIESRLRAMRLVEPRVELRDAVMAAAARSRRRVAERRTLQWPHRRFWLAWVTAMVLVTAGEVVVSRGASGRRLSAAVPNAVSDQSVDLQQESDEEIPRRVLARFARTEAPADRRGCDEFRDEEIASYLR